MILMQGKGVSKGVVKGKLYFYERPSTTIERTEVAERLHLISHTVDVIVEPPCRAELNLAFSFRCLEVAYH